MCPYAATGVHIVWLDSTHMRQTNQPTNQPRQPQKGLHACTDVSVRTKPGGWRQCVCEGTCTLHVMGMVAKHTLVRMLHALHDAWRAGSRGKKCACICGPQCVRHRLAFAGLVHGGAVKCRAVLSYGNAFAQLATRYTSSTTLLETLPWVQWSQRQAARRWPSMPAAP